MAYAHGDDALMEDLFQMPAGSDNCKKAATRNLNAFESLQKDETHATQQMRAKRDSEIKKATDAKRKLDVKREDMMKIRKKNGLVFNKDGSFGVVQSDYSNAKPRSFGSAPTLAADPNQDAHDSGKYTPLTWLCCNSDACEKSIHKHDTYREMHSDLRSLSAYTGNADAKYEKELGAEYGTTEHRVLAADKMASLPLYMKDFMNVFTAFFKVHENVFPHCARSIAEINYNEALICKRLADDPEAMREASATLSASRQAVRANEYTEARDVIFRKVRTALDFTVCRMIQKHLMKPEARVIVEMILVKCWSDFLAHRDEEKLLAQVRPVIEDNLVKK